MDEKIEKIVFSYCDSNWKRHLKSVVKYSVFLANKLDADLEVCEISALLHDITKIKGDKKTHHITGAKEAEKILFELSYDKSKIQKVHDCILTHSSDADYEPVTVEQKIVACADALAQLDNFFYLCHKAFYVKKLDISTAREYIVKKCAKSLKKAKLLTISEQMAKEKYEQILNYLN